MSDQTVLSTFERRLVDVLDAYTAGIVDPTPTIDVAATAMAAGRRPWYEARWVKVLALAALLAIGLVGAMALVAQRPAIGPRLLSIGCGADVSCPEGQGAWVSIPGSDEDRKLFTDQVTSMYHASWLPNGRFILATDQHDIYITGLDGPSRRVIECKIPCLGLDDPSVSPDGTQVAYTASWFPAYEAGEIGYAASMQLLVAPIGSDGTVGEPSVLVEEKADGETGGNQIATPRWSPDGRTLLYGLYHIDGDGHGKAAAIFTVDADGGTPTQLTDWTAMAGDADWAPDGTSIVYSTYPDGIGRTRDDQRSELYLMPSTGGTARQLTHAGSPSADSIKPRFRPDGRIVYGVLRPGTPEIRLLDPRDGTDEAVVTGVMRLMPQWQPEPRE